MKSKVLILLLCSAFFFINTNINVSAANTYTSNVQFSIQTTYKSALEKRQALVQRKEQIQKNISSVRIGIVQLQTDLKNISDNNFIAPKYPDLKLQQLYQNYFYLHQELITSQNKLSALLTQQSTLTMQKLKLQENLSDMSQNIVSLNQTISSYNSKLDVATISLQDITTQLTNLNASAPTYAQLTLQLQQLTIQKNVLEQEILSAQSNLKQLQLNTQNTSDSLLELEQQFTELNINLATQKDLVTQLNQEFNQAKQTYIDKLNYYLAIENNSLSELQTALDQLTEQQFQLTFQINSLEKRMHEPVESTSLSSHIDSNTQVKSVTVPTETSTTSTSLNTPAKKQVAASYSTKVATIKKHKTTTTSHKPTFLLQLLAIAFVIGGTSFFYKLRKQ